MEGLLKAILSIFLIFPPPSVFDGTSSIESKRSTKALSKKAILCQNRPGTRHCSCMRSIEEGYETEEKAKVVAAVWGQNLLK